MGNFNSNPTDPDLASFMNRHGLVDLINEKNGGTPPRTYANGSKRLDLLLGGVYMLNTVQACGSLKEHDGLTSDHTVQWADLDIDTLFGSEYPIPMSMQQRKFTLTNPKKKHKFQEKFRTYADYHNFSTKVAMIEKDFATFASKPGA